MQDRPDIPDWVVFPSETWDRISPEGAGLDRMAFDAWVNSQTPEFGHSFGGQKPTRGGVVLTRGGYLLHTWGDPAFRYQSASLGKTFTRMALQLALDARLIGSLDDRVADYWTGAGLLDAHKVLHQGYHQTLTFRHLRDMTGGFPVTNGYVWKTGTAHGKFTSEIPGWAIYTGDPMYDNYAHIVPGKETCYSSGGYWRLSQALTGIWKRDLKTVLDERLMGPIGIPPERWDWLSGQGVYYATDFYPDMPGYGAFVDPPHQIDGLAVRGGGGWVVMSAEDFARVGLLAATGGFWAGKQLISEIGGNVGVGVNTMQGWGVVDGRAWYVSFGKVTTQFQDPRPEDLREWILGPVRPPMSDKT